MLGKIASWVGILFLGLVVVYLLAIAIPTLPSRFVRPTFPFRCIVMLDDSLAMVEQYADGAEWTVLDSARPSIANSQCKCPEISKAGNLFVLQRYSNLENIELSSAGDKKYLLEASRDDLGGPKVAYLYACDSDGIRALQRYDSFFGFSYPGLGMRYWVPMMGLWTVLMILIKVALRLKRMRSMHSESEK